MRALAWPLLLWTSSVLANESQTVTFVACPIYRDTDSGRKSGCWLADDPATQIRYDVSAAPMKPQLGHLVLVEGVKSGDPDACGGITLRPARTSVLPDTCEAVMIPAEGFPGRRFNVPGDAQKPMWEPRELPPSPYDAREFHILFDLGSDFLVYQHAEIVMEKVVLYAKASRASEIVISGYAQARPLVVSGHELKETRKLARARAEVVALSLGRLGIANKVLKTEWRVDPPSVIDPNAPTPLSSQRRVTIRVVPGREPK